MAYGTWAKLNATERIFGGVQFGSWTVFYGAITFSGAQFWSALQPQPSRHVLLSPVIVDTLYGLGMGLIATLNFIEALLSSRPHHSAEYINTLTVYFTDCACACLIISGALRILSGLIPLQEEQT